MSARTKSRAIAALVSGLLVFSTISATAPAFGEEAPVSEQPSTAAPNDEPAATATPEPVGSPTPAASPEPTSAPEPEPEATDEPATSSSPATVELSGYLTNVASENLAATGEESHEDELTSFDDPIQLFRVIGHGYLVVDISALDVGTLALDQLNLRVKVPAGLTLSDDYATQVGELLQASLTTPLVATELVVDDGPETKSLVNQTIMEPAVHKVYAVLVSPLNMVPTPTAPAANQTSAKAQAVIAHASAFWSDQSNGGITFQWKGTTAWYKSTVACTSTAALWAEAAIVAQQQLGYRDSFNTHLALFLPSGNAAAASCGNVGGRGTVGGSVNSGGTSFNIGTSDSPYELATLTHELGHNLSFGHSSWAQCSIPSTYPGFLGTAGCTFSEYGDLVDVMGGGGVTGNGGSVSSPNAIRAGIWPTTAYTYAPSGSSTYTINAVSTNAGLRSVVLEDIDGVHYFVEFRNLTGRDGQYASYNTCPLAGAATVCNSGTGVRVLRYEQQSIDGVYYKGARGDDTYLITRTVGGAKRANYTAGESFNSRASGGVTVSVVSISGNTATITVTRPATALNNGQVSAFLTKSYDGSIRVGDTMTAMLGTSWTASSYSFQWYRSGKAISGATKQSYVIAAADKGKLVRVIVKGKVGTKTTSNVAPPSYYGGYGPIYAGVMEGGTVSVDSAAPALQAVPANWDTAGTKFAYQWLRNGAAISGAKSAAYTPTASDNGKYLSVKVTGSKSGYNSLSATSTPKNYTVLVTGGAVSVTGAVKVGATLNSTHNLTFAKQDPAGAIASPVISRQWLRSGVAIPTATGASYTLTPADYGKVISLRVSGTTPGWSFGSATSPVTLKVAKGTIAGSLAAATMTKNPTTLELTAALPSGSVTEPAVTYAYQWYRGTAAISKATKVVYKLTSADVGKEIKVRVVVAKSNYDSATIFSVPKIYSLQTTGTATIGGNQRVGQTLSVANLSYTTIDGSASPTRTYQWYRDGKAISGATTASFATTATDFGKRLSVRVIAAAPGYLPHTVTTIATAKLSAGIFTGSPTVSVTQAGSVLTVSAPNPVNIAESGYTLSYQWYRGTAKIAKATKASYTLAAADFGAVISAKVSVAKSRYTTLVVTSAGKNYSVMPSSSAPIVVADAGGVKVGATFSIAARTYTAGGSTVTPTLSYQWLRDGKAIALGTTATYVSGDADKGKTISVKVTAVYPNYLTSTSTSAATQKLGINALPGHSTAVTITKATGVITLTAVPGVAADSGAKFAYQWYRNGAAISKATKVTYTPVAADFNKVITVRVIATKVDSTTVIATSPTGVNVSVVPNGVVTINNTAPIIGSTLTAVLPTYSQSGYTPTYQWYAAGKAISGATSSTFAVTATQKGKAVTVRVIASKAGFLSSTLTSAATAKVIAS